MGKIDIRIKLFSYRFMVRKLHPIIKGNRMHFAFQRHHCIDRNLSKVSCMLAIKPHD